MFIQSWTHPNVSLDAMEGSSKDQAVSRCLCGIHTTIKEVAWVNNSLAALMCRDMTCMYHTHSSEGFGTGERYVGDDEKEGCLSVAGFRRVQSSLERQAMPLVHFWFQGFSIMVEARLSAGTEMFNKSTDIYVGPPMDLMIEVDGEQHFSKPFAGSDVEVQKNTDLRFNQVATANRKNLIRLHHRDQSAWGWMLCQARNARQNGLCINWRTRSYGGKS